LRRARPAPSQSARISRRELFPSSWLLETGETRFEDLARALLAAELLGARSVGWARGAGKRDLALDRGALWCALRLLSALALAGSRTRLEAAEGRDTRTDPRLDLPPRFALFVWNYAQSR
jgi:hypothetical protein